MPQTLLHAKFFIFSLHVLLLPGSWRIRGVT